MVRAPTTLRPRTVPGPAVPPLAPLPPMAPTAPATPRPSASEVPGASLASTAAKRARPRWADRVPAPVAPGLAMPRALRLSERVPPWARKVLVALAVVAFYFAARALNRFRVSFAARDAAIETLIPLMGVAQAREEVDRQHAACFDKAYATKWGKWQDYSFDERKHADCVLHRVAADISRRTMAAVRARPPRSVPGATAARPQPRPVEVRTPATPQPILGRVAVGNVKVLRFTRSPQLTGHLSFVVIGSADAVASVGTCSYAVTCAGQAQGLPSGQRAIVACPVKAQGAKGEGEMQFALPGPAPAEGDCSLELLLTDGGRARSDVVVVPLS